MATIFPKRIGAEDEREANDSPKKSKLESKQEVPAPPSREGDMEQLPPNDPVEGAIVDEQVQCEPQVVSSGVWQQDKMSTGQRLAHVYESSEFADCHVTVGSGEKKKTFNLHKLVLCMTSVKLKDLLSSYVGSDLIISDIDPDTFEVLLQYMYLDSVELPNVVVACKVYRAALKYETFHLLTRTTDYLFHNLSPENVWCVFELSVEFNISDLKLECGKILSKYPVAWEKLPGISQNVFEVLLNMEALVIAEIDVLKAVDRWAALICMEKALAVNAENKRKVIGPEILSKIRFLMLRPEDFVAFLCDGGNPFSSFLTTEETFAVLANLNVPGCVVLPEGLSNCKSPRGYNKFRVSRRTIFKFCVNSHDTPEAHALNIPTLNSPLASKTFNLSIAVSEKIILHGVTVPTLWYPLFHNNRISSYEESYTMEVSDNQNNVLAHITLGLEVNYCSFVDIFLTEPLVLNANETYLIMVSTTKPYYLTKKFRPIEIEQKVKFTLNDSIIPIQMSKSKSDNPSGVIDYGFVVQVIFSRP